jgi:hypothetical protein
VVQWEGSWCCGQRPGVPKRGLGVGFGAEGVELGVGEAVFKGPGDPLL